MTFQTGRVFDSYAKIELIALPRRSRNGAVVDGAIVAGTWKSVIETWLRDFRVAFRPCLDERLGVAVAGLESIP